MKGFSISLLAIGAALFALGCKKEAGAETASTPPSGIVSFALVEPVLATKCISCHGGANPRAGVALDSYANVAKVVKPGDPANSELIQALKGDHGKKRMPPQGPPVPADQIKTIEDWVQAGAKES